MGRGFSDCWKCEQVISIKAKLSGGKTESALKGDFDSTTKGNRDIRRSTFHEPKLVSSR